MDAHPHGGRPRTCVPCHSSQQRSAVSSTALLPLGRLAQLSAVVALPLLCVEPRALLLGELEPRHFLCVGAARLVSVWGCRRV